MENAQLRALFEAQPWRDQFDAATLHRALDLVRAGEVRLEQQVRAADDEAGQDRWLLRVGRSTMHGHECLLSAQHGADGRPQLRASCTCDRHRLCEHLAAVFTFLSVVPVAAWRDPPAPETPAATLLAPWDRWLDQVNAKAPEPGVGVRREFGILLRAQPAHQDIPVHGAVAAVLCAAPVWLRRSKRGDSLVDPQPLRLTQQGAEPAPADGWPDSSAAALALLLGHANVPFGALRYTRIDSRPLALALEQLLGAWPVYVERAADGVWTLAPARPIKLAWQDLANGDQRLVARTDGEVQMLAGDGYWYLDRAHRQIGRLTGDPRLLRMLACAPCLQPEQVPAFVAHLGARAAGLSLPRPNPRGKVLRIAEPPRALLRLRRVRNWPGGFRSLGGGRVEVGCARLYFAYGPCVLAAKESGMRTRRLVGNDVYEIKRRPSVEAEWTARLCDIGLLDAVEAFRAQSRAAPPVEPGDWVWRPRRRRPPQPPAEWSEMIARLRAAGYAIEYADDFPRDELVTSGAWHAEVTVDDQGWFDLGLGIDVGGERVDLLPLLRKLLADPTFPLRAYPGEKPDAIWRVAIDERRSVALPIARLRAVLEPLFEWLQESSEGGLRLHRTQAESLLRLVDRGDLHWRGDDALRARIVTLRAKCERELATPAGFRAELRPYQRAGIAWLRFLAEAGLGGVLADDMGLGKTVQVLAHLLDEKAHGRLEQPALVVCPTSLVGNWRDEAARFAPDLRVLIVHGPGRADAWDGIAEHDIVLTTYPLLPRDRECLVQQEFALLVIDEAQAIKNARSQAAQVVRELRARRRLAMTGTPLENHLGELWAQFDAVERGLLGGERQFNRIYRTPIEKQGASDMRQRLNRRIGSLLLRRRKEDVLTDLPEKTEILRRIELDGDQRSLYEALRLAQHERVQAAVRARGLNQSGIIVLDALLKLRQVCCDPALVKLASARKVKTSGKREALHELLDGLLAEGRSVLLFSQFTEMLDLLSADLSARARPHLRLTGDTPAGKRSELVRAFQSGEQRLLLISLKAGGVGLNLTAADTVIHYDPWWNPAVEAQATDRAHRIGQDKPVFVYKLICAGTVEEKIQQLQARKAELARAVLEGGSTQQLRFHENDLAELFAPLPA